MTALAAGDTWITEWQYWHLGIGPVLGERAQVVAWLDLPRRVALSRLLRRTVARRIRGDELWNGNIEPPLHTFFTRPEDNIIRWEMRTHATWLQRMPAVRDRYPHLHIVRLRTSREVEAWLRGPAQAVSSFASG